MDRCQEIARETLGAIAVFGAEHGRDAFYFPLDDQLRSRSPAGKRRSGETRFSFIDVKQRRNFREKKALLQFFSI
jgi:hypothetical protein